MPANSQAPLTTLAAAYGLSSMGDQMALLALTLRFHDEGQPGTVLSLLLIAGVLPLVVVGPLAGPLLDRMESRRLIVLATAFQALAALGLAVTGGTALTLVLLALLGAGLAVVSPALQLLVPVIVGEQDTARGYARLETFRSAGNVAGPALGGLLVAAYDERLVLLVNALSYAALAAALLTVRARRTPVPGAGGRESWLGQVRQGVGALGGDRVLRTAIISLAVAVAFTALLNVARVFFIRDDLHASDAGFGLLTAAHTAGALGASALLAPRIPLARQPQVLVGAACLMGGGLLLSGTVHVFAVACGAFVLTGVANALQNLAIRNLLHARVPAAVRGRAFASSSALLNGANLTGTALGGPAAGALGGAATLQLAGAGTLLAGLAAAPALLRRSAPPGGPGGGSGRAGG
ncbi:MFS transporter [Streptomyces sp. NPDC058657]|uniref:MFS transporter n=1 Tax=unclassified Streptomyces TaxID=2593676 RepID=UPI003666727B